MKYSQDGGGLLETFQPGSRIRSILGRGDGGGEGGIASQGVMQDLNLPDNPGPAVAGRTPLVGSVRRSRDMPVLRDELGSQMGGS